MRPSTFHLSVAVALALVHLPRAVRGAEPTTADCLAANNSAIDLRSDRRLRSARSELLVCAAASCPADIRKECLRRVDEVNAALPTMVFEAKDGAGNDLSAVKVAMDGAPLVERLEGSAIAVDPGEHVFTFETAGQPSLRRTFVVLEAQKDRRESITFGPPSSSTVPSEAKGGAGVQKILAVVSGGVGVVGVGVGSVFGARMLSKKSEAQKACPDVCATQIGVDLWNDAREAGNLSTVFFIVGGVGLAAGAVFWLTAPSSGGASAQVGLGPGRFQLTGAW